MALVAETALLGGQHPLHDEISALAIAVASPELPGSALSIAFYIFYFPEECGKVAAELLGGIRCLV